MPKISQDDVDRWHVEIQQAERFRDEQFGKFTDNEVRGVGENVQYVDFGMSWNTLRDLVEGGSFQADTSQGQPFTTVNLIHPIVKNIIPSLYFKNPKAITLPKRKEDEDSAPIVAQLLNYYAKELNLKETDQLAIFDAFVLGMGVVKIGYATQFGADIEDKDEEKRRKKSRTAKILEAVGLKKAKEEEKKENPELNEFIRAESPYILWISPFDFLIDPRVRSIYDASWVCHKVTKTLKEVKSNPNYKNTALLNPSPLEKNPQQFNINESQLDNFQTIDLYEIHYKTPEGINILTLAKDQDTGMKPLRHEESVYDMDGFQFEVLTFNKHGHKLYPRPDISIIRGLQDRVTVTFDSILDQVDRFVSKILVDRTKLEIGGEKALEDGDLGAIVYTNADPREVAKELTLTQVKSDLAALVERIIDIMSLEVGLTRAQLTGLTSAETATEAQIGQAGQNLRRADQAEAVIEFANRQYRKLWQVIAQFVDLESIQVITGEPMQTQDGKLQFNWLTIDAAMREKLLKGEYSFDIEVGSTQRPSIEIIRQQASNMVRDLFNPVVEQMLNQEGSHLSHTELLRGMFKLFPEFIKSPEKVLQQATQGQEQMAAMRQAQELAQPSDRGGSLENAQGNVPRSPPTATTMQEEVLGEQRGGI